MRKFTVCYRLFTKLVRHVSIFKKGLYPGASSNSVIYFFPSSNPLSRCDSCITVRKNGLVSYHFNKKPLSIYQCDDFPGSGYRLKNMTFLVTGVFGHQRTLYLLPFLLLKITGLSFICQVYQI